MGFFRFVCCLLIIKCVFSEDASLLKPCAVEDIECLRGSTETFLEKTAAGIPEYDIKPIDPLFIPMVCVHAMSGVMLHFQNVTITGLKNLKIENFKMDTKEKSVVLSTKENLEIVADLTVELTDLHKNFSGAYTAKASAIGTAFYNYIIKPDDQGVDHFEVGTESITCQCLDEPEVTLSQEFQDALDKDPYTKSKKDDYYANKQENRKKVICKIITEAFYTVVHNIRAAAKVLPKTAFFTNV